MECRFHTWCLSHLGPLDLKFNGLSNGSYFNNLNFLKKLLKSGQAPCMKSAVQFNDDGCDARKGMAYDDE